MDAQLVKLVHICFLIIPTQSGLTEAKVSESKGVLVLHHSNINIYFSESALMGFLNCLSDVYIEPCKMSTQPSSSKVFFVLPKNGTTNNNSNQTFMNINCSLHQGDIDPSNFSYFNIGCVQGETLCDTIINVKASRTSYTNNTLLKTYQISWQPHVSVKLINNSFDIISLDTCKKFSTNIYLLYVLPVNIITICIISMIVTLLLKRKKLCRLSDINSHDVVVYEEIESSLYSNIPLQKTMTGTVDNQCVGKSVCVKENNYVIGRQSGDRTQQAGSLFSVYVNFKENDNEAIENGIVEGDQTQLTYYVVEPETESFGDEQS
ncbi:unnamed protein product [Lymnaea stagnalis]|uniref:Uncharacterized protein n=1 Tax=Lymnaea stagnalis TaxID=6523 RepID=A0AAV2H4F1_LYMST